MVESVESHTPVGRNIAPHGKRRIQDMVYKQMLRFPGKSNEDIARDLGTHSNMSKTAGNASPKG